MATKKITLPEHSGDRSFVVYQTPLRKQKILALLANEDANKNNTILFRTAVFNFQKMAQKPKSSQLKHKTWSVRVTVQLETDYEEFDDAGDFGTVECIKSDLHIPWNKRPLGNRAYIADVVRWNEPKYALRMNDWFANASDKARCEMQTCKLVLEPKTQPRWNVEVWYGPTSESQTDLEKDVLEAFEHYQGAGDVNFSILDMKWSVTKDASLDQLFDVLMQEQHEQKQS